MVEWNNVTIGVDGEFVFAEAHEYLLREGYAVAAVSAQRNGSEPQDMGAEPVRLAERRSEYMRDQRDDCVAGDPLSWDIFTQVVEGRRGQQRRCARRA